MAEGRVGNDRRWSLQGFTALVTGGTKGIGYAVVEELSEMGATVYMCSRSEEQLRECLSRWKAHGLRVSGTTCDVSSEADRMKLVEEVASLFGGKLNILINNVGATIMKPSTEYSMKEVDLIMNTNFTSCYHMSQLAHPLLKVSATGNVVFISSVAATVAVNYSSVYSDSKGAMNQLTRSLACEWANDNIRVVLLHGLLIPHWSRSHLRIKKFMMKHLQELPCVELEIPRRSQLLSRFSACLLLLILLVNASATMVE